MAGEKKTKNRCGDSERAHGCFQFDFIEVFWKLDPDLSKSHKETSSGTSKGNGIL